MRIILAVTAFVCAVGASASEGDITVEAGSAGVAVEMTKFDPELCVLTLAPKGKTFVLKTRDRFPMGWSRKACEARFKAAAPIPPPVKVDAGRGSVSFDGFSGRAEAHAEAGIGSIVKS